jgi:hypothetical protein
MPTNYSPKPIDMSAIVLDETLKGLTERLAENVHDIWAEQRISQGWQYGPNRSDVKKTHPSLIPYSELPESEKEYDRRTALTTICALLALGYRIERPDS